MPDLLAFLGRRSVVPAGTRRPLRVQDTQRILKIARDTDDPHVLAGAAVALLSASFRRVAEPVLVQKILQTAPDALFAAALFGEPVPPQIEDRDLGPPGTEVRVAESVARGVLREPDKYPFQTVCQAAGFLADQPQAGIPPLLREEARFGISAA